jgi:serine/threonine-protein phosphatase 2A activator
MAMSKPSQPYEALEILNPDESRQFIPPNKQINDGEDMPFWLSSKAYADIMKFLLQLNISVFPEKKSNGIVESWPLGAQNVQYSPTVVGLQALLKKLEKTIEEAPPDPGPRRFGNISFRRWCEIVESRVDDLLKEHLPESILKFSHSTDVTALDELRSYFLGSFGSAQRLDYGTGHELSFLAFIGCIWKLGGFQVADPGVEERGIVLGVIEQYLSLARNLILTYTLEPAGSHGVWGLDDHSFVPYIFGSAQLSPAIDLTEKPEVPPEGSAPDAQKPNSVTKRNIVDRERKRNMYFSAIGFIYDVKKGPFWEHSPILFDISGVTSGWAKINKGMIKMYNAEVLSKFPVVQHFPFGSLFRWEKDPEAATVEASIHHKSQPVKQTGSAARPSTTSQQLQSSDVTKAPWLQAPEASAVTAATRVPPPVASSMPPTRAPWASTTTRTPPAPASTGTSAPWATQRQPPTTIHRNLPKGSTSGQEPTS